MPLTDDRSRVDPEGHYPSEGLSTGERIAEWVLDVLFDATMERTRDVIHIDWGGEEGVVIVITPEALELRLPTVERTGAVPQPANSRCYFSRTILISLS